jgi:hypothetical protein
MSRVLKSLILSAAIVAATFMAPAQATPVTFTYNGTISSGWDYTGLFGSMGNLAGKTYSQSFTFDSTAFSGNYSVSYDSEVWSASSAPITNSVNIGGSVYTSSLTPGNQGDFLLYDYLHLTHTGLNEIYAQDSGYANNGQYTSTYAYVYSYLNDFLTSVAWNQQLTYNLQTNDLNTEYFYTAGIDGQSQFNGTINSISVNGGAAVPEPASLALFSLGLLAFGFARRRKQ